MAVFFINMNIGIKMKNIHPCIWAFTSAQSHHQVLEKPIEVKRLHHDKLGKVEAHLALLRYLYTRLQSQLRKTWTSGGTEAAERVV